MNIRQKIIDYVNRNNVCKFGDLYMYILDCSYNELVSHVYQLVHEGELIQVKYYNNISKDKVGILFPKGTEIIINNNSTN